MLDIPGLSTFSIKNAKIFFRAGKPLMFLGISEAVGTFQLNGIDELNYFIHLLDTFVDFNLNFLRTINSRVLSIYASKKVDHNIIHQCSLCRCNNY